MGLTKLNSCQCCLFIPMEVRVLSYIKCRTNFSNLSNSHGQSFFFGKHFSNIIFSSFHWIIRKFLRWLIFDQFSKKNFRSKTFNFYLKIKNWKNSRKTWFSPRFFKFLVSENDWQTCVSSTVMTNLKYIFGIGISYRYLIS